MTVADWRAEIKNDQGLRPSGNCAGQLDRAGEKGAEMADMFKPYT